MDYEKQIEFWRDGSVKALRSIPSLIEGAFWSEALFWTHLSVEKAFKAHVVVATHDLPPYTHKLTRLAEVARMELSDTQLRVCEELNEFQIIARYPDEAIPEPDAETAQKLIQEAMEFQRWLLKSLSIS